MANIISSGPYGSEALHEKGNSLRLFLGISKFQVINHFHSPLCFETKMKGLQKEKELC